MGLNTRGCAAVLEAGRKPKQGSISSSSEAFLMFFLLYFFSAPQGAQSCQAQTEMIRSRCSETGEGFYQSLDKPAQLCSGLSCTCVCRHFTAVGLFHEPSLQCLLTQFLLKAPGAKTESSDCSLGAVQEQPSSVLARSEHSPCRQHRPHLAALTGA